MIALGPGPCDEGVIRGGAGRRGCAERAKPWILVTTILGSSMAFIDGSVVNVALPAIQNDLEINVGGAQWVANSYMLMLGALILVGGAAGDRFGHRRVFSLGIIIFTAASIGCGLAPSIAALIAARTVQGIGGALLVPGSLAIISAAFPEDERGKAIGSWAGFTALTTAAGPVLGGWLVDALSWRAMFFINVRLALLTLVLAFRHVPESSGSASGSAVDWLGGGLATLGLAGLAYGVTAAPSSGWNDPLVIASTAGSALVLGLFVLREGMASSPMMPLGLFRSAAFSGANAMTFLLYLALSGVMFLLPFNLINIQRYSATLAGAAFLPFTLIIGGLSRWSGGLVGRYGARIPLTIGPIIAAAGLALFAVPGSDASYWTTFFPAMAVLGLGMAVSVAPLTTTVMAAVDEQHGGVASGINNAVSRVAGMLAVAFLGALAIGVFGSTMDQRLAQLQVSSEIRRAMDAEVPKLAEAKVPAQVTGEQRRALEEALNDAFVRSFRVAMLAAAALALASALCAGLTIGSRRAVHR